MKYTGGPPRSESPHVTTRPSLRSRAKAAPVAARLLTGTRPKNRMGFWRVLDYTGFLSRDLIEANIIRKP